MDSDMNHTADTVIVLTSIHPYPSPQAVPLANAFIKSYASSPKYAIELADFFIGSEPDTCLRMLVDLAPSAVGFSVYVWNRDACILIAERLRIAHPGILIFAGGPEVTAAPDVFLESGAFDCIIAGEGEIPCKELFRRLSCDEPIYDIPGIITTAKPVYSTAPMVENLDSIPSPYLGKTIDLSLHSGLLWQLSRGCGFACDFCFDARGSRTVRRFSLERIEAELRFFVAAGVSQIFVLDSTFNQDVKRAKAILRLIGEIAPDIHFHFEVRSEFIDREMASLFTGITCSLQIGLQSANPQILAAVGRTFRPDDFCNRVNLLNEYGATFGFDLMYGLPGDTLLGFRNSLDFSLALYPNHLDIFPLAILPGTTLAKRSRIIGLNHQTTPPYTLTSSPTFSPNEMDCARRLANACDIFYTRGRAVAWFNSVLDTLQTSASRFLETFSAWMDDSGQAGAHEKELDDAAIKVLQLGFLKQQFASKRLRRYLPLVNDLVEYHYRYAQSLMVPSCVCDGTAQDSTSLLKSALVICPSVQLAEFNYEILELLDTGAPALPWIYDNLKKRGSHAVIYPHDGSVCTEALDYCFYNFLSLLDGKTPAATLGAATKIPPESLCDFLEFAWNEGIILKPN